MPTTIPSEILSNGGGTDTEFTILEVLRVEDVCVSEIDTFVTSGPRSGRTKDMSSEYEIRKVRLDTDIDGQHDMGAWAWV